MYDTKCESLARWFLLDHPKALAADPKLLPGLAQYIQDCIEDFLDANAPSEE